MNSVAMLSRKIVRFRRFYGLPFGSLRKLGLSLFAFAAFALASEAQVISLTNNLGNSGHSLVGANDFSQAQGFTTGANALGYNLTSLILKGVSFRSTSENTITLHKDSQTGTKVADFTDAITDSGATITYTPTANVVLEANTDYFFVTKKDFFSTTSFHFVTLTTETGSAGWSIKNDSFIYSVGNSRWTANDPKRMFVFDVRGSAVPNAVPTASNNTVATRPNTPYTFSASDFGFTDTNSADTLASVKITTLETAGDLELDGTDVTANQVITKADIDANKLIFTPATGGTGAAYATFGFSVNDGTADSAASYTMTIDVLNVPVVTITSASSVVEGNPLQFTINVDSARSTARTVHYRVSGNISVVDRTALGAKTVVLPANATSVIVNVPTEDDTTKENDVNIFITLLADTATPATYTIGNPGTGIGKVTDDDPDITVTLTTPDVSATEQDNSKPAELVVTLSRTLTTGETVSVPLFFSGGILNTDFRTTLDTSVRRVGVGFQRTGTQNWVNFTSGSRTAKIFLTALADADAIDDIVTVSIPATSIGSNPRQIIGVSNSVGIAGGIRTGNGQITVTDDDEQELILGAFTLDVTEESSSTYTVKLASEPTATVTVTIGGTDLKEVTVDTNSVTSGNQNTLEFTTSNWATAQTVTVAAGDDAITGNYTATLTHTASGGDYGTVTQDLPVTVEDNDIPTVSLSLSSETIQEGGSAITVTATRARSNDSGAPLVIPIAVKTVGTTADAADYTLATSISIPDSATIGTTTFTAATDSSDESSETVIIELGTPPDGTIKGTDSEVTVTITDANPTVASLVRVGTGDVTEGTAIEFTVSLNRTLTGSEIVDVPLSIGGTGVTTADWSLALKSGSASTGLTLSDATTTTPNIRFTGVTSAVDEATFTLTTTDDDIAETGTKETFQIALGSNGSGANGFDASSLGTNVGGGADPSASQNSFNVVVNDPALPVLSIDLTAPLDPVTEGDPVTFTITSDSTRKTARTVHYSLFGANDYFNFEDQGNDSIVLPAGDTSVTVSVPTVDDSTDEPNDRVIFSILSDTATPATYTTSSTQFITTRGVEDNDATPVTLTTPDATATEEDSDATAEIVLTLGRSLVDGESIAVPLIFSGGTLGTDFSLSLKTSVTGVTLSGNVVTIAGINLSTATVLLTALTDADAVNDTVTVSIPAASSGAAPILTANICPRQCDGECSQWKR